MKLATRTADFLEYTQSQIAALEHIKNAGFKYADYSFGFDYGLRNGVYSENCFRYFDEVALAANDIGIKLVQAHAPMGKPLVDDGGRFIADTIRCVEACGIWGIPNLVVHSGYIYGLTPEQTFEQNRQFFLPILNSAEKYGVNILVENFNKMYREGVYWIDNAPDLLRMIEHVNHPLFHAVWDVGHANLLEQPQNEAIRLLGRHVYALHIQDNLGDRDTHLVPFLGTTNMDSVMNGLLDIGYDGYFTFEVGSFFTPADKRRAYTHDTRLARAPLQLRDAFERYLYELGKCILDSYGCFEE